MKIMFMSQYYPPNYSAAATRTFELAKHLASKKDISGITVITWNPLFNRKDRRIPEIPKVKVREFGMGKGRGGMLFKYQDPNPIYAIFWLMLTIIHSRREKPDTIIFSTPPGVMLAGALWCRLKGIRYAIDYRDNWIRVNENIINQRKGMMRFFALMLHRATGKLADFVNANAALVYSVHYDVTDAMGIPRAMALEVRNGVDGKEVTNAAAKHVHPSKAGRKYIAYVGNLQTPYYSPEVILPTIRKNPDYHLLVFSTSASPRFNRRVKKLEIKERTSFLGVEHGRMLSLLKGCDAGIMVYQKGDPQGAYAIPAKFYDYISSGVPVLVIADRTAFVHSFVREHGNGIALSWKELGRIGQSIESLITDPGYGRNARKIVPGIIEKYDRGKYNELLANRLMEQINQP